MLTVYFYVSIESSQLGNWITWLFSHAETVDKIYFVPNT
jgi:hypothetical protein